MVPVVKSREGMLARAELKSGLAGTPSRSFPAVKVLGWEGGGGLRKPSDFFYSCSLLCPPVAETKLEDTNTHSASKF